MCTHVYLHAAHEAVLFSKLSDIWPGSVPKGPGDGEVECVLGGRRGGEVGERKKVRGGGERSGGTLANCTDRHCERTYNGLERREEDGQKERKGVRRRRFKEMPESGEMLNTKETFLPHRKVQGTIAVCTQDPQTSL